MKIARLLAVAVAGLLAIAPAVAKNFAVPTKNPAITITVPNDWKTQAIDYGFSARPQDESVFFSVESADARNIDKLLANNDAWMKHNKIKKVEPIKADAPLNGIPATIFQYQTSDGNGPTTVDLILLPGGNNRMIMLTVWGSDEERAAHGKEIEAIFASIKSIN